MQKLFLPLFCFIFFIFSYQAFSVEHLTQNNSQERQGEAPRNDTNDLVTSEDQESIGKELSKTSTSQNTETIKVTGSRISRIDTQGASPMTVWTKEDLDKRGYFNLGEFFQNTSLSNFGDMRIHDRSTLVLVNGSRMVHGEAGQEINQLPKRVIDIIPIAAIEKVEVLRDGASALYGSDVVGGVINIITKKDYTFPEVSLKISPTFYPLYKGGSQTEASVVFGKKFNRWHFISALQFQYSHGFKRLDRKKWYASDFFSDFPYYSFLIGDDITVKAFCPDQNQSSTKECKKDLLKHNYISPNIYDFSSYNYMEYKLNSDIIFYSQWLGFWQYSKRSNQFFNDNLGLSDGHGTALGEGSAARNLFFEGSDELTSMIFLDGLVGVKGYISKTWDFDLSLKWSNVWDKETHTNYLYKEDLVKIFASGDPISSGKGALNSIRRHDAFAKSDDKKIFTSLDFSGESGIWDIDLAFGLQGYYNNYRNIFDPVVKERKIFARDSRATGELFERYVLAAYVEGIKTFSNLLEVQLAGRVDRYSDFGWTVNPKMGIRFQPSSQFLIRSSIGTSFEAPPLIELYTPPMEGEVFIYDTVACYNELKMQNQFGPVYNSLSGEKFNSQEAKDKMIKDFLIEQSSVYENKELSDSVQAAFKGLAGQMQESNYCNSAYRVRGVVKGNKDLKETRAVTASLGFQWELHKDHSLELDGWFNSLSGVPIRPWNKKKTTDTELRYGKEHLENLGIQKERAGAAPHPITSFVMPVINAGGKQLYGINARWMSDFSHWTVAEGNFYFQDDFSYVIESEKEDFKGMGSVNNLGKFGIPRWKNFATVGWKNQKHNISLVLKSIAAFKSKSDESVTLPMGHILDLFYKYDIDIKTSLGFGWYNLLFSDPVLDDSIKQGPKFDQHLFDVRGPRLFVELRRKL